MILYDISIPLRPGMAVWPGDTDVSLEQVASLASGDTVNLGSMTASLHAGTHIDAPYHFDPQGLTVDAIPPEVFLGPALMLDVSGRDVITVGDLAGADLHGAPRLLLRTGAWPDHSRFPERIPTLAADLPAHLASCGVFLLGLDIPSVDALDSKELPNHHALATNGIHIIESLDLSAVEPGLYQLSALPLRIHGSDAAPTRAVLWRDG